MRADTVKFPEDIRQGNGAQAAGAAAEKAAEADAGAAAQEKPEEAAATTENEEARQRRQEEIVKGITSGTLALSEPMRAGGQDVHELAYDFSKITGMEYADAMDRGKGRETGRLLEMSSKQALWLFARAVSKVTRAVDETDVAERLGAVDALEAVQLTQVFFTASMQIKNRRTLKKQPRPPSQAIPPLRILWR